MTIAFTEATELGPDFSSDFENVAEIVEWALNCENRRQLEAYSARGTHLSGTNVFEFYRARKGARKFVETGKREDMPGDDSPYNLVCRINSPKSFAEGWAGEEVDSNDRSQYDTVCVELETTASTLVDPFDAKSLVVTMFNSDMTRANKPSTLSASLDSPEAASLDWRNLLHRVSRLLSQWRKEQIEKLDKIKQERAAVREMLMP